MAARVGSQPSLPVTSSFKNKPVKFNTFINALKAHYDQEGSLSSYAETAFDALFKEGSFNTIIRRRNLDFRPDQQTILERKVKMLLSQQQQRPEENKPVETPLELPRVQVYPDEGEAACCWVFIGIIGLIFVNIAALQNNSNGGYFHG